MLGCALPALADAPPAQIQAILDKIKNHQTLTPEELRQYQDWSVRKANQTDTNPANAPSAYQAQTMPADVQAIIAKAQQGQKPSDDELARLRAWATQTKSRQGAIRGDLKNAGDLMRAAGAAGGYSGPPARSPAPKPIRGTVTANINQVFGNSKSTLQTQGTVTFPVIYKITDDPSQPNFHLRFDRDPMGTYTVHFSVTGRSHHDKSGKCDAHDDSVSGTIDDQGLSNSPMNGLTGEIVTPPGFRAYTDAQVMLTAKGELTATCPCGGGHGQSMPPLSPLTLDRMRGDVPFNEGMGDMPIVGAGRLMDKYPAEMQSTLNNVVFDFSTAAFQKARTQGGNYTARGTYHYKMQKDDGTIESTTLFVYKIQFPPSGKIVVTPDSPQRAQKVTLHANVQGATQYHWSVTGGKCPQITALPTESPAKVHSKDHDGQDWSFTPLCDFHVELHATGADGQTTDDARDVTVQPRTDQWHFNFTGGGSPIGGTGVIGLRSDSVVMSNGKNRCDQETNLTISDDVPAECDWIHRTHGVTQSPDYSDSFGTDKVSDDGPFDGYGYVSSQSLKMKRQIIINVEYLVAGPLRTLNNTAHNGANFERIHQQVLAHEHMHDTLARKAINANDPSMQIEVIVTESSDGTKDKVNKALKRIDGQIGSAADENAVGNALHATGQWEGPALICLRGSSHLLNCGPLYTLGTPLFAGSCSPADQSLTVNAAGQTISCP